MNIGDYVRTDTGIIGKITDMKIEDDFLIRKRYGDRIYLDNNRLCLTKDIIKSSPNIIDLIEVGDYVNGEKVLYVGYSLYEETKNGLKGIGDKIVMVGIYNNWGFDKKTLKERDIKSIVTHEMFESMQYKVGE